MTRPSLMIAAALVLTILGIQCAVAAPFKRVMILNPYGSDTAPLSAMLAAFRSSLALESGQRIDFHDIPLDLTRFDPSDDEALVDFLEQRLKKYPVDLVVPLASDGVNFAARHRARLFPDTPLLLTGVEPRRIPPGLVGNNAALVTQPVDLPGVVHQILRMKPGTKNLAVVLGASDLERKWADISRREFEPFSDRLHFIWLDALPLDEMLDRASRTPPDTFIFHALFFEDGDGIPCSDNEALKRLHAVANAPIFSLFASEFGLGPVGGELHRNGDLGREAARVAARILNGESPDDIEPVLLKPGIPVYDWRELRRWRIPVANLPADGEIRFREPGFWERYRWPAIAVGGIGILQAALIAGLLVNRSRRLESEQATALVATISSRFVNLPADRVDHEIHEALRRICEVFGIDMAVLWQCLEDDPGVFTATHVFGSAQGQGGGPSQPSQLIADDFPWIRQRLMSGQALILKSLDELPPGAEQDRKTARRFNIKSTVTLPLTLGGLTPIGILGFNNTRGERRWSAVLVERLNLIAEILANALARKKADHDLRESIKAKHLAIEQTMELRDTLSHAGRVSLLGQLASSLAHELSQPLGAILRNAEAAEIMLRQPMPDVHELRAIIEDILRDDYRASEVIQKLRSLLRKGHLEMQALNIGEVISDVIVLLRTDATGRHVCLTAEIDAGLPKVLGDRIHLQQVLLNLIVNAMDALGARDEPGGEVRVRARRSGPTTVEVKVCDNGPGIPAEHVDRLFEPFYTTKATGMGMGLLVSQTIVEAHKGKLTAENQPDGGACFCFTLTVASP